jgi:hypothetical protein
LNQIKKIGKNNFNFPNPLGPLSLSAHSFFLYGGRYHDQAIGRTDI